MAGCALRYPPEEIAVLAAIALALSAVATPGRPAELLEWMIRASEAPRRLELSGNDVAYDRAIARAHANLHALHGRVVEWEVEIESIKQDGITVLLQHYRVLPVVHPSFTLGSRTTVPLPDDEAWVDARKVGEKIRVRGSVRQVKYYPSPTVRNQDRDKWGYSFMVELSEARVFIK